MAAWLALHAEVLREFAEVPLWERLAAWAARRANLHTRKRSRRRKEIDATLKPHRLRYGIACSICGEVLRDFSTEGLKAHAKEHPA